MSSPQVVVIGGGAAGFFAAIACAETHPHSRVVILEKSRALLSKVRISGGGRCNVTHACFEPSGLIQNYPRGGRELRGPFTRFQPRDTVDWFARHGVRLKTEADGRLFPVTDRSETIVDCLIETARRAGVEIRTEVALDSIERSESSFVINLKSHAALIGDRVLLATGSNRQGYQWAAKLGHTLEPPVPSLFTFTLDDARLIDLAGISVEKVRVQLDGTPIEQIGPVLITHWGLSGPAILKLSAWGARVLHDSHYHAKLLINWLPDYSTSELQRKLAALKAEHPRQSVAATSPLSLPSRLWKRLAAASGIGVDRRWADVSKQQLLALTNELSRGAYAIKGKGVFKEEFVTCGGVRLDEVNFKTMESRRCPGLYFAGEILDIDGITGGFNFQSAWTTGWIAGRAMGAS